MNELEPGDSDDGGFDPQAFARRQAHLADAPRVKIKIEPPEPREAIDWVEAKDAPLMIAFKKRLADLGKKPKPTSGPLSIAARAKLAEWQEGWSAARLELTRAQSAIFDRVDLPNLGTIPGALYHLQLRADRRRKIVAEDESHLAKCKKETAAALAALEEADAPARAGRELALTNVQIAFTKLLGQARKEAERHKKHEKDVGEAERHELALAELLGKTKALQAQKAFLQGRLQLNRPAPTEPR